jgi:hypothetical protein
MTEETQASNRLSDRLRNGLALAQTRIQTMEERAKHQWTDLPAQLRTALDRAFARIRTTLDLPSRADMSDLMDRLEALDRKIGALEKGQGKRGAARSRAAAEASADDASEGVTDAEIEAAEGADGAVAAAAGNDVITESNEVDARSGSTSPASAASEGASQDTSRKTLQAPKGTSAGKTLKASDATTRPVKNGDNRSKSAKQRSKKHGGRGGKA